MGKTYSYDPAEISKNGLHRMRFELGDTMVEGKEETTALADEEIKAMIEMSKGWKRAKLACIESIFRRFSYEPDTTTGPLSFKFGDRARLWKEEYEKLKEEVGKSAVSVGAIGLQSRPKKPPYFHTGMMSMEKKEGRRT